MKRIINGKRYDSETARLVGKFSNPGSGRDFQHYVESLYQKRTGEYFLYGIGGPMTQYAVSTGQNSWSGGSKIIPFTADEARDWAEEHLTADEYEAEFPVNPEPVRNLIGDNIKRIRESKSLTQTELAEMTGTDQRQIWRYESGETTPDGYRIIEFAHALGVEPGELLK